MLFEGRIRKYEERANEACEFFSHIPHVRVNKPKGVFYLVVELLDLPRKTLDSVNKQVRLFLDDLEQTPDNLSKNTDFQFAYELMGSEGVCVVPLTGFSSEVNGFRMTLLQENDEIFTKTLQKIGRAITEYYS